jgi:protein-tyrosine sulfotransferase
LQARKLVSEAILNQIISLNRLDMELYDHAKKIFTQEHLMLKAQQSMVGQHRQFGEQKVCSNSKSTSSLCILF